MKSIIKKQDIILISIILLIGLGIGCFFVANKSQGDQVVISIDNEVYGTYDLFTPTNIVIEKDDCVNEIVIENGEVYMENANCSGEDCVHQGEKSETGETIICIPNKVIVEVIGGNSEYDSITN